MDDNIPIAPCQCQHHGDQYAEFTSSVNTIAQDVNYDVINVGATIVSVSITTTKRCCIVVNSAMISGSVYARTDFEIERPSGTIKTTQEDDVIINDLKLMHHATWEVLDPGTYTYYLVNRGSNTRAVMGAWVKAVASDCEDR